MRQQAQSAKNGSTVHLFSKVKAASTMVEMTTLNLKAGYGIEGDINANSLSPRQVLVVRHEDIEQLSIHPGELRENIVIAGIESDKFVPGSLVNFESGAAIRLTFHCEPCKRVAHLVESLKQIEGKRGILGVVTASGKVEAGGSFQIETNKFPALSENPYERFLDFIQKIPMGKIVTYKHILQAIGVDKSYLRAIPIYIKKTSVNDYPIYRVVDSQGYLISHVYEQQKQLEVEGIHVLSEADLSDNSNKYFVNIKEYSWEDKTLFL